MIASGKPEARALVQQRLQHSQQDGDLAGIRDATALQILPDAERKAWQAFWADVQAALKQTTAPPAK